MTKNHEEVFDVQPMFCFARFIVIEMFLCNQNSIKMFNVTFFTIFQLILP